MTARGVRRVVLVVCAAGIAGMIVSSIADSNGGAVTFGLITAVAVLCLMVATAVARTTADTQGGPAADTRAASSQQTMAPAPTEELAADLEGHISALVAAGADEAEVRALAGEAVRLGKALAQPPA